MDQIVSEPLPSDADLPPPIRGVLFSVERLEQYAHPLAASHVVAPKPRRGAPLLKRLAQNGEALRRAYDAISTAVAAGEPISPAAEWLVDNFHIVEEQLREIKEDLPAGFYRKLPKLAVGPFAGYPRVFSLAWGYVEHTDSLFDPKTLSRFVMAYQEIQPLTLGELWAIAISLRLVMIENLRRLADRVVQRRVARAAADALADAMTHDTPAPTEQEKLLDKWKDSPLWGTFIAQAAQRLRDRDPEETPLLALVGKRLADGGRTIDEVVQFEHQQQVAGQLIIRNVITSMRLMSLVDWAELIEGVSLVETALRQGTDVAAMDFATRDTYRHAVEELAQASGRTELNVAEEAVRRASLAEAGTVEHDPGFHLVGPARKRFERDIGARLPLGQRLKRSLRRAGTGVYLSGIVALTLLFLALFVAASPASTAMLVALALLALIPATEPAVALVNRTVAAVLNPRRLPRLELIDGVPQPLRTMVVVPVLLTSEAAIEEHVEHLEAHHLANDDGELYFALLSDWADADTEETVADAPLLAAARRGIAELNRRHRPAPNGGPRFHLFHRRRVWNESQRCWMGWERKRGKLHELNRLLRGATDTTFVDNGDEPATAPAGVRYVLTLDADTRMPRTTIRRLVGTLAHPLNWPVYDPEIGRVTRGHGILQPRVVPTLQESGTGSLHQEIYAGPRGIDAYEFAISDVYQDLFDEGIFIGKGLYEVDAFETALADRVPENTVLSHDLFEGIATRAALVTDIELFEDFPGHYEVNVARRHRWVRGDWQLLPWIFGHGGNGRRGRQPLPLIGRWKMLDNLRRSLVAPTSLAFLVVSWCLPEPLPLLGTLFILLTILIPSLTPLVSHLTPVRATPARRVSLSGAGHDARLGAMQAALAFILLPHQAWVMSDAIVRTISRLIRRRNLLEWVTAAAARTGFDLKLTGFYRRMMGAVVLAVAAGIIVGLINPTGLLVSVPVILVWLAAPAVAWRISLPRQAQKDELMTADEEWMLRSTARRTWRFFERFVNAADNFLPPDNFQEDPRPEIAHRTSPTNIGLYLLSAIAARDFGWIGTADLTERLEATSRTLDTLQKFRGHLYNWYETRTLEPLEPRYISTVDSGNLAGHLMVVRQACLELMDASPDPATTRRGVRDTLRVLRDVTADSAGERAGSVLFRELDQHIDELDARLAGRTDDTEATPPAGGGDWQEIARRTDEIVDTVQALQEQRATRVRSQLVDWANALQEVVKSHLLDEAVMGADLRSRLLALADWADAFGKAMRFDFLYNRTQKLFAIGYRPADSSLDTSTYDLLASEARLASLVAIARGEVPASHWFRLGRPMTPVGGGAALVSWSASMFEYLMPELVMDVPAGSILSRTARCVVAHQIAYGKERGVPWGISESAYNVRDLNLTYQYSNFGVAGLGLKRGLSQDVVVAPYATALAAMVDPAAAAKNLGVLAGIGARGAYGFYEAVDYTANRLPQGRDHAIIRAYMAHHQGMTVVALANILDGGKMRTRFHNEPVIRAAELLLQERMPRVITVAALRDAQPGVRLHVQSTVPAALRRFETPHTPTPRAHLLSNGRYSVMLTVAGSGYSQWQDLALTRWREDSTRDCWGSYIYIKDPQSGKVWSAGYQPTGAEPDSYEVNYSEERAEIRRQDGSILTKLEVLVAAEDDVEVRQLTISNLGARMREIEVTSYAEIVLTPQAADAAHPAFSNLFVQTEFVPGLEALVATRRARSADTSAVWAAHMAVSGTAGGGLQYETDRARFIGRGRSVRNPGAIFDDRTLSNTLGSVLDPIFSLRRRIRLAPGARVRITFVTIVADSRDALLSIADRYRDETVFERTGAQAWTRAQVQLHHLGISRDEAHLFQRMATRLLYIDPHLRAPREVLQGNRRGPRSLWAHGISGDRPIILLRVDEGESRDIARQLLRAQRYWRAKGLIIDLVFLNEQEHSYQQHTQETLEALGRASQAAAGGAQGGVFTLKDSQIDPEDLRLLMTAARVLLESGAGTLAEQVIRLFTRGPAPMPGRARLPSPPTEETPVPRPSLEFFNGLGGFTEAGQEYVVIIGARQQTPAPWVNVIANPAFGFVVSESGSGYSWCGNSHENQLTPWSNDPVGDPPGEAIYIRDEDTGETWCPTPLPIREESPYVCRHGQGYSRFEHASHDIGLSLVQFVPREDPVKISRLVVVNRSRRPRTLTVTAFVEWVLGPSRAVGAPYIVTSLEPSTGAIFARNPWNYEFADNVAFFDMGGRQTTWTGDRTEFIGRNGSLDQPAGLAPDAVLTGRLGPGMDPCAAMQATLRLAPDEQTEVLVLLGEGANEAEATRLVLRYRRQNLDDLLSDIRRQWDDVVGTLRVKTPERAMDILLNSWLLYQTLSCRVWARAAFYQAGGAFGFRDQLQDTMALAVSKPDVTQAQLLLAASRQFPEGDVQHWWHPPSGRGVRTHISDDLIWLPVAVAHYAEVTGDAALLDAQVPFIEGPPLPLEQHDAYFEPQVSAESASLFEHCARALDARLDVGRHGLPLIGTGDWNDGMNRVGHAGKGESVWMGWFMYYALLRFAPIAERRGETKRAAHWRSHAESLREAVEREGWDGDWYRRAFFDDGTPLGTAAGEECRIDSLSQSWGILSGAADPARAARAIEAVDEYLIRQVDGIALLLTPPFDRTSHDPGYIKGYLPGIRENGGQYTHAAVWALMAHATIGNGDRAMEVFNLINPIHHGKSRLGVQRYKIEPYVLAGDVYGELPHVGRGGWSWYTGSAAWMYRAGIEWILGFRLKGKTLHIDPCIPSDWPGFKLTFRYHSARYEILVDNPERVCRGVRVLRVDGHPFAADGTTGIPLVDDGATHTVDVVLGEVEDMPVDETIVADESAAVANAPLQSLLGASEQHVD
ncbi:MAG: glucoamylase family protein [Rhodospirillales bacterium]